MEIRGRRECVECGTEWSYYETGNVTCPSCGSLRSVGLEGERRLHTASPETFDLTPVRNALDAEPLHEVASRAKETAREYVRTLGYVRGGELLDLSDSALAAHELVHVADVFGRSFAPSDDEELYFLSLLRGADEGERPAPSEVPDAMRDARGLAYATAVRDYRRDVRSWVDHEGIDDQTADEALETLAEHVTRVRALDGDVSPRAAESLVEAARDLAAYVRDGDETAASRLDSRFDTLESL